jgi:hypothetical protein
MSLQVNSDVSARVLSVAEIDAVAGGATLKVTKVIFDMWGISIGEGELDGCKGAFVIDPQNHGKFYPYGPC